ncbi:MAG: M23 family metallopeptidase [Hyphomicrobiales bacterium]|nr:M23 family metallopeptidase [Hyphomicrobiales bacterium]
MIYKPRQGGALTRVYLGEVNNRRFVSRLKWLISTCIVGATGLAVIGVVMYASMNIEDGSGMIASIRREGLKALQPKQAGVIVDEDAATLGRKTDRIIITAKGLTTRHTIQDSFVQRRNAREFIQIKQYARVVASLATERPRTADLIPALNPIDLYGAEETSARKDAEQAPSGPLADPRVEVRVYDLAGGFLPQEDGQELSNDDIERFVAEADAVYSESEASLRPAILPEDGDAADEPGGGDSGAAAPALENIIHTRGLTIAAKSPDEDVETEEDVSTRSLIVKANDTLPGLIKSIGAEVWQTNTIAEVMASKLPGGKIKPGQELRYTVLAGDNEASAPKEPLKISLFNAGVHVLTVKRNAAGEYALSDEPVELPGYGEETPSNYPQRSTVYLSAYQAALAENLPPDFINKFLRIHTYDVDYKLRVQIGDGFELFYEVVQDENGQERPGELLYAAFTIGGQTQGYYRFRTPDGQTDYYDEKGSNSKKFLMRTPIKAGRLTSGFGYRRHPLLGYRKLHTGVDWGAPIGTPILAAGNGVVEVAGREGGYGNYIRIRHSNGYKTAYAHQSRFAPGIARGVKVRQGQIIGYVGNTGLSSGPHLHYEVLVNNRHMNPMSVQVPRSRQLQGRNLADYKKERVRIDELMKRAPVRTRVATMEK